MVWYVGSPSYAPSASTAETGPSIWSSSGPTREASPSSVVVSSTARISLLSGSTARCSRRQLRRGLPPCFSCSHSPAPKIFSPLESITTLTGPFGFFSAVVNDRPTGQGGVVRHRQIEAEHLDDGAQHSFGLAPRLAHRQAQHHSSFDDNVRVGRRPPASSSLLRCPGLQRFGRHPHRQAAPLLQSLVILPPVGNFVPGFRDFVTARFVVLVRHGGSRQRGCLYTRPSRQPKPIYAPKPLSRAWFSRRRTCH